MFFDPDRLDDETVGTPSTQERHGGLGDPLTYREVIDAFNRGSSSAEAVAARNDPLKRWTPPNWEAVDEAVADALLWLESSHGHKTIEDFGRDQLADARGVGRAGVDRWMERNGFNIRDIRKRYREQFGFD